MGVVFALGFVIILIILALMVTSFMIGTILLIVGFVKQRKYRNNGKKKAPYQVMIGVGAFMAGVPAAIILFFVAYGMINPPEDAGKAEYSMVDMAENWNYEQMEEPALQPQT